jgi:hypothetical protein
MTKVFISSVMHNFETLRQAARNAVEGLRQKPIMAEDFGAKPYSSKVACTEGVRQSDIYVGVLGRKYGFVTAAGVAVTEEEFAEARKQGLPILWFVQNVDREPDQQAFFERISGYEEGFFLDFFDTPADLQMKITRAVHDHVVQPGVKNLDAAAASVHLAKYVMRESEPHHSAVLGTIIFPSRQGGSYLSPIDMGRAEVKERLLQRALFGASAILSTTKATETVDGVESLAFIQKGPRGQTGSSIELFTDGTVVWSSVLASDDRGTSGNFNLVKHWVIDQDDVQRRLAAFASYCNGFYAQLEDAPLLSSFYIAVVLRNVSQKWFGHHPASPPNTMTMAMNNIPDPMLIPSEPLKIGRAELGNATKLSATQVALTERAFKACKRYYEG